jgi:hypothetical protein
MSQWVDSLPDHRTKFSSSATASNPEIFSFTPLLVRWSPNMGNRVFATQSATLFLGYYLNQILIYRPFIPSVKSDAAAKTTPPRARFPFPLCRFVSTRPGLRYGLSRLKKRQDSATSPLSSGLAKRLVGFSSPTFGASRPATARLRLKGHTGDIQDP